MGVAETKGLPRPIAEDPHGKLRPIPWTQNDTKWGQVHDGRLNEARFDSLCLVCGDAVVEGVVLWDTTERPVAPPESVVFADLVRFPIHICDGGPLHRRCAKITRCHCATIRNKMALGLITEVPYRG